MQYPHVHFGASRALHNQVQELQGNIRVFCRVRPLLADEEGTLDHMEFPDRHRDSRKLTVSSSKQDYKGMSTTKEASFTFDRVHNHGAMCLTSPKTHRLTGLWSH
jgi:hypothetical protein